MKKKLPDFKYEKPLWKKGFLVIGVDEVGRGALAGPLYVGAVCFTPMIFSRKNLFGSELASRLSSGPVAPCSSSQFEGSLRRSFAQTSTSLTNLFSKKSLLLSPYNLKNISSGGRSGRGPASAQNFSSLSLVRALAGGKLLTESEEIEELGINDSKKLSPVKRDKYAKLIKKICLAYATTSISNRVINRIGIVKVTQKAIRKAVYRVISKVNGTSLRRPSLKHTHKFYLLVDAFYIKFIKGIGLKKQKAIIRGDEKSISIAAASIIAKVERDHTMIKLDHKYPIYFWKKNKGYGTRQHIKAIKKDGKSKFHRDLFLRKII